MNNTVPAAPVRLAPIPPAAIPRNEDERDALLETCDYTRKGEIPRMVVTRQQLIEDVLARGYVVMDVSTNKRTSAVQSVALRNPVTKQFYRFQRKGEVSYIQRRHAEVMTKLGQPAPAQQAASSGATDEGWRLGETVSQTYTAPDGETYQITGKVTINSAQRWRVRLEDTAGAPGLRLGQIFPALAASWKRAVSVPSKSAAPTQKPAPLPAAEVEAKATVPALNRLAAGSEVMLRPDCGGEVFGRVIATPSGQLVRVMKATGAAAMTFPRGRAVPFSPEWEQIGADAAATVSREPGMAPAPLTAPTPEALQNTAPAYSEFNQPSAEFEERCDALNLSGVLRLRTIVREAVEKSPNFVLSSATSRHDLYMQEVPKAIQALSASVASWTKGGAMAVDYTAAVERIRKEPTDWFVGLIEAERIAMDAMAERAGWAPDKRIAVRLENAQGAQPVEFDAMTVSEADHGIAGVAISAVREADDILVVDDRTGSVICRTGGLSVKEALAHAVDAAGGLDAFRAALQAREGIVAPEIEASAVPEMDEPQQAPSVRDPRDYLTGDRLQKVGNLGARLVALGMPEAPETYVAAFAVMEAVEQGKPCPVLAQLPCRQLYEELTGVQLAGKAGVVADEIVRSTAPQPVPPADTDSEIVDRVAGLPKVGEVFAVETLKGDTQSYEYAVVRGLYEPGYLTVALRPVRPAGSEVAEWESAVVGHRTTMSAAIDRFVERLGWRTNDGSMTILNPEVQARVDRAAKVRAEVGLAVRREADLKQKFRDAIGAVKLPKSHRAVVRLLKTETDVPVTAYEGIPFVLRQGSGSVIHGPSGLRVADFVSRGVAQDFIRATILSGEDYSTGLHGDASALDHAKLTRLAELVRNFSTNGGDYIVPAWFKPAQTTVAESAPAPEATVVPPAPAAAPVEQPPAPVPARAEDTNPAAENVEPWELRYETYLFRVGKEPDIARGVRDFIDPVSGKSIAQLREELRSARAVSITTPSSSRVDYPLRIEMETAILEHHIASVKVALEAGKPVPEDVKTEYELHIGIRPEMTPARSAIAEKYAQKMMRIHLDWDANERKALPRHPAKIYDAYDRRALAGYRKHMQDVVDKLDAKSPEIHSWINSNNFEGTISLMFEYTGWGDSRKTLKNAEACLKSWMGAEAYDAMIAKEAQDRAAAAEEQAKKEKDYRLNSAIQRLDGVSVRYTPRGQTEAQTVTRRQWLDAIMAEGYNQILRRGPRIWLTTPDHHAYVIRADDVVYVEAQIEATQKGKAEQAQPAVQQPPEAPAVAEAPATTPEQPAPAQPEPVAKAENPAQPEPVAKAENATQPELFPQSELSAAQAAQASAPEPTEAEMEQAAIAASRAAALAEGGAAIGAGKVEALTIVDLHTAAGAQRMCVVGQGKDGTITLVPVPTAEHATEPIASVVALRENVTVPALNQAVLRRPAGDVFAAFVQHAERASRELSPDDPLAKEVSSAIAFANRADAKGLAEALRQPDLAVLIGDAILLFQPEVAHLAKTMKAELPPEMRNWYYSREDAAVKLAERGETERFKANVEAIRLLKLVEAEERQATPQEKDALAAFSGWGAHKGLFNSKMAALYKAVSDQYEKDAHTVAVYDYDTARNKEVKCETLKEYVALWGREAVRVDYQPRNIKGEPIGEETRFFIRRLGYYDYKNQPSGEESFIDGIPLKSVLEWGKKWAARREEVAALLTAEEWRQAEASSLNAFYTSPDVSLRMWDIVKNLGFQGGKVLEPACGCGRIVSAMPPEYRDKCRIEAVELDPFSARISAKLLPEAKVHAADFREAPVAPNSCDLVITNVPFGSETVGDSGMNLHNWYISECMTKLKPGGLAVIITTQHTMDSSADQRAKLVQAVEFLDAFRLPNNAFDSEGTQVTTDILVLRKPSLALAKTGETWMHTTPIDIAPEHRPDAPKEEEGKEVEVASTAFVNEFYQRHPERVIGQHSLRGKLYGGVKDPAIGQYTVEPVGDLSAALAVQVASVKAVENSSAPAQAMTDEEIENTRIAALRAEKTGSLVLRDGTLYVVSASRDLVEWSSRPFVTDKDGAPDEAASAKFAEKNEPMARAYVELRGALIEQLAVDSSPESDEVKSATTRATLKAAYDGFTKKYGRLNAPRTRKLLKTISGSDPDLYTVFALEDPLRKRENGKSVTEFVPAQIISRRTLWPSVAPEKAENLLEGTYISMAERGRVDADYIARLLGREGQADAVRDELLKEGIAFRDVDGELVHREIYLTGDVNTKIQQARVMAEVDGAYMANVQALEAVLPPQIPYDEIVASGGMSLSASWLPAETLTAFVKAKVSFYGELVYKEKDGWVPARATGRERNWSRFFGYSAGAQDEWGTKAMHFADILRCALAGVSPKAFDDDGHADPAGTREAELRVDAWKKAFGEWVAQRPEHRDAITDAYNRTFNRVILTKWDGSRLRFPGLAQGSYIPMAHQKDATMRMLLQRRGVIAHGVGFGKTLEIILAAAEMKRLGMVKKPMIVCDNANYEQIVREVYRCYPTARILQAEDGDMSPKGRDQWLGRCANGEWDFVIMSREQFGKIRISPEREVAMLNAVIDQAEAEAQVAEGEGGKRASTQIKRKKEMFEKIKTRVEKLREKRGDGISFEQLGVDQLFVDESHRHKKIGIKTRFDVKGIDVGVSNRGFDLLMKANYLRELNGGGRGAIGFTGTPVSNTLAEMHTACVLFDPPTLAAFDVKTFDQFVTNFCEVRTQLELNESNGRWRYVERLARYVNGRSFSKLVNTAMDVRMNPDELGIKRPGHEMEGFESGICPLSRVVYEGQQQVASIYKAWEEMEPKEKALLGWVPLVLMGLNTALSIDPRLVDPKAVVGKDALINGIADNIAEIYHAKNKGGKITHTQVVFSDRKQSGNPKIKLDLARDWSRFDGAPEERVSHNAVQTGAILSKALADARDHLDEEEVPTDKNSKNSGVIDLDAATDENEDEAEFKAAAAEEAAAVEAAAKVGASFNLWEELRRLLVARGVPADKIALISDVKSPPAKLELMERMNAGEIAVLIGSRDRLGIGCNYQKLLYAAHAIDPSRSMTPDSMEQSWGRILRQGNTHEKVRCILYGMADTVIPAIYGRINTKAAAARQVWIDGTSAQFDASEDMAMEIMRAAMLTDSRAKDAACLLDQINDLELSIEAINNRRGTVANSFKNAEWQVQHLTKQLAEATHVRDWFAENVTPIQDATEHHVTIKFQKPANPWERTTIEKAGFKFDDDFNVKISGSADVVEKVFAKLITQWRAKEEDRAIAYLTWNGVPAHLGMRRQFHITGDKEFKLEVQIPNPLQPVIGEGGASRLNVYMSGTFLTPETMLTKLDAARNCAASHPNMVSRELEGWQKKVDEGRELLAKLESPDALRAQCADLRAKQKALLDDMQERPFAGQLPAPAGAKRCEITYTVPEKEARTQEARKAAGETATAAKEAAEAAKAAKGGLKR